MSNETVDDDSIERRIIFNGKETKLLLDLINESDLADHEDLKNISLKIKSSEPAKPIPTSTSAKFTLGSISLAKLEGVHPDLVRVVKRAIEITPIDFRVLEGRRSVERQRQLLRKGATTTMKSRHITGHAVDIAPLVNGVVSWDWKYYTPLSKTIKQAAHELGISIEWGGDWIKFKDGPHWQLPRSKYP